MPNLNIVVNLPEFMGKDVTQFAESFGVLLRMTGQTHASRLVKCDLILQCWQTKYVEKQVKQMVTKSATFADLLVALERQYPSYETNLSIRTRIQNLAICPTRQELRVYFITTGRFGPMGLATEAWIARQQRAAFLVGDQDPTSCMG